MGPDYVHMCDSKVSALDNESVLKTGNWEDYTGSGTVPNANLQGKGSKAGGKMTGILNVDTMNVHGKRKALHRTRQHLEYIEVS